MTIHDAETLLQGEEGRRSVAYPDSRGIPTIGIGHADRTLIVGVTKWTDDQIDAQFRADFVRARDGIAKAWPQIAALDDVRRAYLVSMAFQLGVDGVLAFRRLLAALAARAWQSAYDEALNSDWHHQTPGRCERAATAFFTGQWQQIT